MNFGLTIKYNPILIFNGVDVDKVYTVRSIKNFTREFKTRIETLLGIRVRCQANLTVDEIEIFGIIVSYDEYFIDKILDAFSDMVKEHQYLEYKR